VQIFNGCSKTGEHLVKVKVKAYLAKLKQKATVWGSKYELEE